MTRANLLGWTSKVVRVTKNGPPYGARGSCVLLRSNNGVHLLTQSAEPRMCRGDRGRSERCHVASPAFGQASDVPMCLGGRRRLLTQAVPEKNGSHTSSRRSEAQKDTGRHTFHVRARGSPSARRHPLWGWVRLPQVRPRRSVEDPRSRVGNRLAEGTSRGTLGQRSGGTGTHKTVVRGRPPSFVVPSRRRPRESSTPPRMDGNSGPRHKTTAPRTALGGHVPFSDQNNGVRLGTQRAMVVLMLISASTHPEQGPWGLFREAAEPSGPAF